MPKTQSIAEAAKAAIPGYTDAKTYLDTLARWKVEHPHTAAVVDPLDEFRATARSGGELPTDIGQRINDSERAVLAHQRTAAAIFQAHNEARNEVANVIRDGADHALEYLHREILKRQDTIREAAKTLDGVTSADQAMRNATHREAWAQLAAAVDDVDQIRTTQWSLYKDRVGDGQGWFDTQLQYASVAFLTNALDYSRLLTDHRRASRVQMRPDIVEDVAEHAEWLDNFPAPRYEQATRGTPWWPTDDHTGYLIWATRVTSLWVPTIDQIEAAHEAAKAATAPLGGSGHGPAPANLHASIRRAKEARETYYKITGGTPHTEERHSVEPVW